MHLKCPFFIAAKVKKNRQHRLAGSTAGCPGIPRSASVNTFAEPGKSLIL